MGWDLMGLLNIRLHHDWHCYCDEEVIDPVFFYNTINWAWGWGRLFIIIISFDLLLRD
jgi:hypothetical protein